MRHRTREDAHGASLCACNFTHGAIAPKALKGEKLHEFEGHSKRSKKVISVTYPYKVSFFRFGLLWTFYYE